MSYTTTCISLRLIHKPQHLVIQTDHWYVLITGMSSFQTASNSPLGSVSVDEPFPCGQCSKVLTTQANLKVHLGLHTGEGSYICVMCQKVYIYCPVLSSVERG